MSRTCALTCSSGFLTKVLFYVVAAPWHEVSNRPRLPDFGLFHVINTGSAEGAGLLAASPITSSSYGTTSSIGPLSSAALMAAMAAANAATPGSSTLTRLDLERARWTHGGDLFQDPTRYDSDDGTGPSPRFAVDGPRSSRGHGQVGPNRIPFDPKSQVQ